MICKLLKRGILATLVAAVPIALVGASGASAEMPWWHVNTISAPASTTGGPGRVVVEVSDLGDAPVIGSEHPVTIVDRLPAGVVPSAVYGEGGGGNIGTHEVRNYMHCSIVAQTVTCMFDGPRLLTYERLTMAITVTVAGGSGNGTSEVNVTGGGAPPVQWKRPLKLSDVAPPYGVENYELTPEEEGGALDTQAGSHPFQLTTTLTLNTRSATVFNPTGESEGEIVPEVQPIALTKDLNFDLPPGFVGNPTPLPKCSMFVFTQQATVGGAPSCPNNTVVGVATPVVTSIEGPTQVPWEFTEPLYSLEPAVGEPARFGFILANGGGLVILDTSVLTGGSYAVVVGVHDIPETLDFIGNQVTFWGVPGDARHDSARGSCLTNPAVLTGATCAVQEKPQPFLVLPTSCTGPLQTSVDADSWAAPGQFTAPTEYAFQNLAGETYGQDGCDRLNFEPSISVAPDGEQASTPTGLTVDVHVPQDASLNPTGLAESSVKNTTVTLPAGVGLNPAGADGLSACGIGEIALESPAEQTCPEAAKVGTVEIKTPLLPNPLVGAAYLATQDANPFGSLVALYIVARDPVSGVLVKLAGQVTPDPVTGQLVSTFKNTPQLPFEDLSLHFFGGSRAPLGTPALCGPYTTTASIEPWSGEQTVESSSTFDIKSGPNGTPCSNPLPFAPSLTTGSLNLQAGAFTPFRMTMSREDGNQNLDAIQLKMPPGLLGHALLGQAVRRSRKATLEPAALKA